MSWFTDLFLHTPSSGVSVAHAVVILGLVTFLGLALGSIQVLGIRLGVAGVLFVGLAFGHFGLGLDHTVLEFARDFGLILFVYTIGLQIGPGFGASLRKQGLPLNLLAAGIVLLGVLLTILLGRLALPRAEFPAIVGVFSGATTNTPSLAAAQQALGANAPDAGKLPALGYAVAYPFGVIGIILSMFLIRWVFRVNLEQETRALAEGDCAAPKEMERVNVQVTNKSLHGMTLERLMAQSPPSVLISRVQHDGSTQVAAPSDVIARNDVLLAVGPPKDVRAFAQAVGEESPLGWMPRYEDLDWTGMENFSQEQFQALMTVDRDEWQQEILSHDALFFRLYDRLPKELIFLRELILSSLWRSPEHWGAAPERV